MKKFKTKENIEKHEFLDDIDKKLNEDLCEIKEKLNNEKLSNEFKENLQVKLERELNKTNSKDRCKILNFSIFTRKLAGICACFIFLFSGCIVFADDIENIILDIFCNTDRMIQRAIENGNYKEIDMEYVENNGISIKVDYIVVEKDCLYIAFNILKEEKFDKTFVNGIVMKDQNDFVLNKLDEMHHDTIFTSANQLISLNKFIVIYKLVNPKYDFNNLEKIKFEINNIDFIKNNNLIDKYGMWKFEINI